MDNIIRTLLSCTLILGLFSKTSRAHNAYALTYELDDNDVMCFHEHFDEGQPYILEYQVLKGGKLDVDVLLESPNGKEMYKKKKKKKDVVHFESSYGTWKFCFSNEFSTISHKTIYFELRPESHRTLRDEAGNKIPSVNTQLEESLEAIHSAHTMVVGMQTEYRLKEARGRYAAESLGSGVQWWSLIQAVIILLAGSGQVFVLKTFFTERAISKNFPRASTSKQVTP